MKRLLGGGNNRSVLDDEAINEALLENALSRLGDINKLILIHDPSDIRKEYSTSLEGLGQVRDLSNNIINGYSSFNSIALDAQGKSLTLLNSVIYSNRDEAYVTEDEYQAYYKNRDFKVEIEDSEEPHKSTRQQEVARLIENDEYINHKKVFKKQLSALSQRLKEKTSRELIHILDREHDSIEKFKFIDQDLNDLFVVRLKTSRTSTNTQEKEGKECQVFEVSKQDLELLDIHVDLNYTIIHKGKCFDNRQSRKHQISKIFYCNDDITKFLKSKEYVKNIKLTKAIQELGVLNVEDIKSWYKEHTKSTCNIKLIDLKYPHVEVFNYQQFYIKDKAYQDIKVIVSWGMKLEDYSVIKVEIIDRKGKAIFLQPMLLCTNKTVNSSNEALAAYHLYLTRSKIEGVFRFLKNVLGWEDCQLRNFANIKNILTLCFFIGGYFYEIESSLTHNEMIEHIAFMGGGKGKVTRHYILEGLAALANKVIIDEYIKENKINQEQLKEMYKLACCIV